jgi:ribosomal protein S18 acetylase RimI-like enzyme
VLIRPLATTDFDALQALDVATQREYRGAAWTQMTPEAQKAFLWTSAEDLPLHLESGLSFVAEDEGAVVGFVIAFIEPVHKDPQVYIDGIAVAAAHRRRGIAEALYNAVVSKARSDGFTAVLADISLDNKPSQKLHAKQGFVLTQRIEARLEL